MSSQGTTQMGFFDFCLKRRPESGLDCLMCALFAQQRLRHGQRRPVARTIKPSCDLIVQAGGAGHLAALDAFEYLTLHALDERLLDALVCRCVPRIWQPDDKLRSLDFAG